MERFTPEAWNSGDVTPTYHSASLGGVERTHKDLKANIKATLIHMANEHTDCWMEVLLWVLLGRRTTYQPDLGACPAELVFGSTPLIPGDLVARGPPSDASVGDLLSRLRQNATRPPVQTSHHGKRSTYLPASVESATAVYVRRGKSSTLGPTADGPFQILERLGTSCLRLHVGSYADGSPRTEIQHWENCTPAYTAKDSEMASRPALGRKPEQSSAEQSVNSPQNSADSSATPEISRPFTRSRAKLAL